MESRKPGGLGACFDASAISPSRLRAGTGSPCHRVSRTPRWNHEDWVAFVAYRQSLPHSPFEVCKTLMRRFDPTRASIVSNTCKDHQKTELFRGESCHPFLHFGG